jgi:hypothetical protein
MSAELCSWCRQKILTKADLESAGKDGLCLTCLLSFLGGERPERRRAQRRRLDITPREDRRFLRDRRQG